MLKLLTVLVASGLAMSGCSPGRAAAPAGSARGPSVEAASTSPARPSAGETDHDERVPVVVELFSSEGCSSCPPADEALRALADEQPVDGVEIVPLELHVDYWNDLGWADPFSSADFSLRQHAYADARGARGVFTPEAVVDGSASVVATEREALLDRIRAAAARPHEKLALDVSGGEARLSLPTDAAASTEHFDAWIAVTEVGLSTDVKAGENRGRTLRHAPVVRALRRVGRVPAEGLSIPLPELPDAPSRYRVVVLLQSNVDGHVVGAASRRL